MPISGAERASRYRQKLKQSSDQYDVYRKNQVERVKTCQKSDRNEKGKEKRNILWRQQKQNQALIREKRMPRLKKVNKTAGSNNKEEIIKKYISFGNVDERLILLVETLRKQIQEAKSEEHLEVEHLEHEVKELEAISKGHLQDDSEKHKNGENTK